MATRTPKLLACLASFLGAATAAPQAVDTKASSTSAAAIALPTVDLGYEIHQAIAFNVSLFPPQLTPYYHRNKEWKYPGESAVGILHNSCPMTVPTV